MSINDKQKRFCHEYIVDYNATQAAIRAGYSERSAYNIAHNLMKNDEVQSFISSLSRAVFSETYISKARILQELTQVMIQNENLYAKVKAIEIFLSRLPDGDENDRLERVSKSLHEAVKKFVSRP
jgi:phage terminase small subunit